MSPRSSVQENYLVRKNTHEEGLPVVVCCSSVLGRDWLQYAVSTAAESERGEHADAGSARLGIASPPKSGSLELTKIPVR